MTQDREVRIEWLDEHLPKALAALGRPAEQAATLQNLLTFVDDGAADYQHQLSSLVELALASETRRALSWKRTNMSKQSPRLMKAGMIVVFVLSSCGKSVDDGATPAAGVGGQSFAGTGSADGGDRGGADVERGGVESGAGGGSVGGSASECAHDVSPECCETNEPCRGLSEEECLAAAYCSAIEGVSWTEGQAIPPQGEREYVGCKSQCDGLIGPAVFTCILHPEEIETCFVVSSGGRVPDGWLAFLDCEEMPEGSCSE